jgi:outer membrane protein OmpA-like peptidoglycan-associated protein
MSVQELGDLGPYISVAGQIAAAGLALVSIVVGKGAWAPPKTLGLSNYANRIVGLVSGVGLIVLYVQNRSVLDAPQFARVAAWLVIGGLIGGAVYLLLRVLLCFKCTDDPTTYVKGLRLKEPARRVLAGQREGLPDQYAKIPEPGPANDTDFFCGSGKDHTFVWKESSHATAQVLLFFGYALAIVPLTLALASGSMAVTQVAVHETVTQTSIDLPSDVFFDFRAATIKPAAAEILSKIAADLRQRTVRSIRIEGHTDSIGTPAYNKSLSEARAGAVAEWLVQEGQLGNIRITPIGFGATRPVAPNANPDGTDDPIGRAKNRRVNILLEK